MLRNCGEPDLADRRIHAAAVDAFRDRVVFTNLLQQDVHPVPEQVVVPPVLVALGRALLLQGRGRFEGAVGEQQADEQT